MIGFTVFILGLFAILFVYIFRKDGYGVIAIEPVVGSKSFTLLKTVHIENLISHAEKNI